jgi:hypothetical protein
MRHQVRQRLLPLILAIAAAVILTVPLWASLSPDWHVRRTNVIHARSRLESPRLPQPVTEAGSLLLTGGLLIALASVVRRAS